MSGHSKWSTIKRKKGAADANPRLRLAIDKARLQNMPKDNIERAIKKGTGDSGGAAYDEVVYEGYGPGGTAILLETLSDNRNRTVSEVRHVFSKHGGNLGASGCVNYLFEKKGILQFDAEGLDADALLEAALEAGADDVVEGEASVEVTTSPGAFESVRRAMEEGGFAPLHAAISLEPTTMVKLEGKDAESMLRLADALEDLDDVQSVNANFDISEEEMARIASP
jgi:YebC/PmpR family DNA-binding regulatory protein